jgi:hypothetical protein
MMKKRIILLVILLILSISACEEFTSSITSQPSSSVSESSNVNESSNVESSLVEVSVTPEVVSTNANISGLKDSYKEGETASFTVTPDTGYKLVSVKVNNEIIEPESGVYSVTVGETLKIEVEVRVCIFSLSGTVKLGENNLTEEQAKDFFVVLENEKNSYDTLLVEVEDGYGYVLTGIEEADNYVLKVLAKAEDVDKLYEVYSFDNITVFEDVVHDVIVSETMYGENRIYPLVESYATLAGMGQPYNYGITGNPGNQLTVTMLFEYDQELLNEDGSFIADPTYGEDANKFMSLTIATWLISNEKVDGLMVQLLHWGDSWYAKIIGDNNMFVDYKLSTHHIGKLKNGGLEFKLSRIGNLYHLYVEDLSGGYTMIGSVRCGAEDAIFAYMDNKVEGGAPHGNTFKVTGNIVKTVMGPKFSTSVTNVGDRSVEVDGDWNLSSAHANESGYKHYFMIDATFQYSEILDEEDNINYIDGLMIGYRLNVYDEANNWGRFDLFVFGYDGKYYLKTELTDGAVFDCVLSEEQLRLLATTGLRTVLIRNTTDTRVFADDGNGELVEYIIATNGNYNFKYLDILRNNGSKGTFNTKNIMIYHGYNQDLTNAELIEFIK